MLKGAPSAGPVVGTRTRLCLLVLLATLLVPAVAGAAIHEPAYDRGHRYRHGVVPIRGDQHTVPANMPGTAAVSANNLNYGGSISGVGVTTGPEQVYLVFWGSQWGSQGSNSSGAATFSGDPRGVAPDLQAFFKGLGTGGETWSGVMTQYCQGISAGSQTCPGSNTQHVGYPTGGALAGVWEDNSGSSPSAATAHQIAAEAVNAAAHFGNTSQASNRNTQYVIVSPTGANPDRYKSSGFCAWHDYSTDGYLDGGGGAYSPYGILAFTNLPYLPDAGYSCGQGFVNNPGTLDGVTIVGGHEYAETVTDQFPAGGWTDASGNENGDKCAWISSGQGASQDISLSTGSFAVQSTWANDFNGGAGGCEVSHPIVSNTGANTVTVTNPGNQSTTKGVAVSLQMSGNDTGSGQTLTYSATGLPAGLTISSGGLITGSPTTPTVYSVKVTATDSTGASGSTSFTWTINNPAGNTVTVANPGNQSTTKGVAVSLQMSGTDTGSGQTLAYSATGLPAGLTISSGGLITGSPTTPTVYSVKVTATDSTGASGSTSFTWTVNAASRCTAQQLLGNPGFETGSASPWSSTAGVINSNGGGETAHSGSWFAWLDGYGTAHTDTLSQQVAIPSGCSNYGFSFWLHIDSAERSRTTANDVLKVQVLSGSGAVLATLATYSNLNVASGYSQKSFSLASYAGQTVTLQFTGTENSSRQTSFVIDDTALNVS